MGGLGGHTSSKGSDADASSAPADAPVLPGLDASSEVGSDPCAALKGAGERDPPSPRSPASVRPPHAERTTAP